MPSVDVWAPQLSLQLEAFDPILAEGILRLRGLVSVPPKEAVADIAQCGVSSEHKSGWEGISPFVTPSVLWSLYAFFRHPEDYCGTIRTAIAVGGDVDTTAAMAGAISGAYLGIERLPLNLAKKLNDRRTWAFEELVELAHCCHRLKRTGCDLDG